MRSFSVFVAAALLLSACAPKAQIDCTVADAPSSDVEVCLLDVNVFNVLDTVRTDASGRMRYSVDVKPGQPEFVYLFRGGTKLASLLLSEGEKAVVKADTLGVYEVEGSPESLRLAEVEGMIGSFSQAINAATDGREAYSLFIRHYRECTRFVLQNPKSLTVIPVLFQQLDANTPLFCQYTDALLFRNILDSLKTVYPESRYVKALEKETVKREDAMKLHAMVGSAPVSGYPDINYPDINGQKVALSSVDSRAVLLHFWDSSSAENKMFNLDYLMPLWERWNGRGLQIYAVDVNPDKSSWAATVKAQKLPWINVNDGLGARSAVMLYNVSSAPVSFLLVDGDINSTITDIKSLEKELSRRLK